MIELLLALVTEPAAVQEAQVSPLKVVNTAFIVERLAPPFAANIRVVVQNTGTEADELVAVSTPLGEPTAFRTDGDLFSRQEPVPLPIPLPAPANGEASYLPLIVWVPGLENGNYRETGSSITLRFARGGEITVPLTQSSPAPPPAR